MCMYVWCWLACMARVSMYGVVVWCRGTYVGVDVWYNTTTTATVTIAITTTATTNLIFEYSFY